MGTGRAGKARDVAGLVAVIVILRSVKGWDPGVPGPHPMIDGKTGQLAGGRMTWSMTWMTPLEAMTSGVTTWALSLR